MTPATTILQDTAQLFSSVRRDLVTAARNLYLIQNEDLWKVHYSSFGEYVELECQISPSFASKLVKVYRHYVLEARASESRLGAIDAEKLYLASRLNMPVEEQLVRAQAWSRSELKAELAATDDKECDHESQITICARCHARV